MNNELQNFIEHIVSATNLKGKTRERILQELCSHILEEEKELQLAGYNEEKIFTTIQSRWGNTKIMSQELSHVHTTKYTRRIEIAIIIFMLLSVVYFFFGGCTRTYTVVMPSPPETSVNSSK